MHAGLLCCLTDSPRNLTLSPHFKCIKSAAQSFVESDRAGMEGETLTFIARLWNLDNSGKISATALTVAAFQAKYPELEVPCGIDQEKAAEGIIYLSISQSSCHFVFICFRK